jgi:hypothetical protein
MIANNAVRYAIGIPTVSLSAPPLPLLDEEMTTKADNGRMK